jgi:hypothetical protein
MNKIDRTLDFDDLVKNFDLNKFIKFLDKQCEVKMTNPPHHRYMEGAETLMPKIYEKPPDIYFDLLRSCENENMSFEKLRDDIYKNDGDFIDLIIESGKLLQNVSNNFQIVYNNFEDYYDGRDQNPTYGFHLISSKINDSFYLLVEHYENVSPMMSGKFMFFCMKKFKDKNLAIEFVKEESKNLKNYYK